MSPPRGREARILMVDDEPGNLMLLQHMLEREGYRNLVATPDPKEVLTLFQVLPPDIVLLDLNMPGMDGFAVMEGLRELISPDEFLPILVITGDSAPETRQRALSSGATDFVTKPFDAIEVLLRIRNLLHTRSLQAAVREQNRQLEALVAERTEALRVALRRAEAASEAKSLFLAKMSHELRTPLTPLHGALEMLADVELPDPGRRFLELAAQNAHRMLALVNDILYLQAIEQGDARLEVAPVHLRPLVLDVAAEMAARAAAKGLALRAEVPEGLQPLATDPRRLMDVLTRLLDNALRFTPAGSVTVRVVAEPGSDVPARLEVADSGVGIAAERREAVFEPFEQADNSSTRRYEGAGIGLTISRTLCHLLGYRLEVESEPGAGSTFRIVF